MLFSLEEDARRVMAVLPKRFGKYGLTLHPEKTKLVEFIQPNRKSAGNSGGGGPGTFDLLGFTHYWGLSRWGNWAVKRKTATGRFSRALGRLNEWCRDNRHLPVKEQWEALVRKLRGHFGYYGIIGNAQAIHCFRDKVVAIWRRWLDRRSHSAGMTWDIMKELLKRYPLPPARIMKPRFTST